MRRLLLKKFGTNVMFSRKWDNLCNFSLLRQKGHSCLKMFHNSLSTSAIGSVEIHKSHLTLKYSSLFDSCKVSLLWLRDHCRCPECYNYITNQRIYNIFDKSLRNTCKDCVIQNGNLQVTWVDKHVSTYPMDWLAMFCGESSRKSPNSTILWNKNNIEDLGPRTVDMKYLKTDQGLKELLTSLIQFGIGFVDNVPPSKKATQEVVETISHVQRTFFGDMWEFSDSLDHQDTAYSRQALEAHTDNTYFSDAAGLQIFHCLLHDGEGGETLLVDGFHAASCLKRDHSESYKRLSKYIIDSEYKELGRHYLASGPILRLCSKTGELIQIRFNMYDRGPLQPTSVEEVEQFYEDVSRLSSIIADSSSKWWFKLIPGKVLFINNWRILHGRASYTGHRKIAGCYVGHSDWHSKARVFGLL